MRARSLPLRRAVSRLALALLAIPLTLAAAEAAYRWSLRRAGRAAARGEPGAFTLYAVGDSTAWGEPFGEEANIGALAARRFPRGLLGRPVRVVLVAEPGGTSRAQLLALRKRLLGRDRSSPAAVLIYCGHNDRTIFDTPEQPAAVRLLGRLARRSFVLGDLYVLLERRRVIAPHGDLPSYEANLRAMLETSLGAGALPILSTSVSNEADIDPRLYAADGMTKEATLALLDRGEALEASGPARAVEFYRRAEALSPKLAPYAAYRLGRTYAALGRYAEARRSFVRASEEDHGDNFGRATPAQNEAVRRLAEEFALPWVDAEAAFRAASPNGLLGSDLFADGHHPDMEGRLLLADGFARALSGRLREPLPPARGGVPEVEAELGLDARRLAAADVYSGKWWLYSAVHHLRPRVRLAGARLRLAEAVALDPDDFSARLARGLVEFEEARGWLDDEAELAWFRAHGFAVFVTDAYPSLSSADLDELLVRMRRGGVGARTLREIERTSGGTSGLLARRGIR